MRPRGSVGIRVQPEFAKGGRKRATRTICAARAPFSGSGDELQTKSPRKRQKFFAKGLCLAADVAPAESKKRAACETSCSGNPDTVFFGAPRPPFHRRWNVGDLHTHGSCAVGSNGHWHDKKKPVMTAELRPTGRSRCDLMRPRRQCPLWTCALPSR